MQEQAISSDTTTIQIFNYFYNLSGKEREQLPNILVF